MTNPKGYHMKHDYVCKQCGKGKAKDGGVYCKPCRAAGFDELLKLAEEIRAKKTKDATHENER